MKASVSIHTKNENGLTRLGHCFFSTPFKVMNITENKSDGPLQVMLMSASPGILDGDEYDIEITVGPSCQLHLHTQAYQRCFTMQNGATSNLLVNVGQGAIFQYLPHPTVPHKGAIYKAKNTILLESNSVLIWGEVLTCGRGMGKEIFAFTLLHNITAIYYCGKLVIKENQWIEPATQHLTDIGQLEGFTHQASFIYWNENMDAELVLEGFRRYLDATSIHYGCTTIAHAIVVRLLGFHAEQLMNGLKQLAKSVSNDCQQLNVNFESNGE